MTKTRKDCADKLIDALWAYWTAFETALGLSPYTIVYGCRCHLLIEYEHRT